MKIPDLERANINTAHSVIILSKHVDQDIAGGMVDADTIFIYKTMKLHCYTIFLEDKKRN